MMVVIEISFLAVITFKLNSILKFHFDKVIHKIKVRINEEDLPAVLLHSALRYISKTVPNSLMTLHEVAPKRPAEGKKIFKNC